MSKKLISGEDRGRPSLKCGRVNRAVNIRIQHTLVCSSSYPSVQSLIGPGVSLLLDLIKYVQRKVLSLFCT